LFSGQKTSCADFSAKILACRQHVILPAFFSTKIRVDDKSSTYIKNKNKNKPKLANRA